MPNLPVQVIPLDLPLDYCPPTYDAFNKDILRAQMWVEMGDSAVIITGSDAPDETLPDNVTAIWALTDSNGAPLRFYRWSPDLSRWISPHPVEPNNQELRMWRGTLAELKQYQTDHSNDWQEEPTEISGPFWEPVLELSGRSPIGVNDATTGGPDETLPTITIGQTNTGTIEVPLGRTMLVFENLPQHAHAMGAFGTHDPTPTPAQNDNLYLLASPTTTPMSTWGLSARTLFMVAGSKDVAEQYSFGWVNAWTFDAWNNVSSTREVVAANTLGPIVGVYYMKRTIRRYYSEI